MIYRLIARLMKHRRHACWLRPVALAFIGLMTIAHPLFHHIEGGAVDAMLTYLDMALLSLTATPVED